jgi:hypothetical protein
VKDKSKSKQKGHAFGIVKSIFKDRLLTILESLETTQKTQREAVYNEFFWTIQKLKHSESQNSAMVKSHIQSSKREERKFTEESYILELDTLLNCKT